VNVTGVTRACAAIALLAGLTGCGSDVPPAALARPAAFGDLSAEAITSATLADMRKEKFISLAGTYYDKDVPYTVRAKLGPKASCHFEVVGSDGKFEMLLVAGDAYWKYSEKALRSFVGESRTEDAFVEKAADRWIEGEAPSGEDAALCDRSLLLEHIEKQLDNGEPEVSSDSLRTGGATVRLLVSGGSITIDGGAPHLVEEMAAGSDLLDFRYHDKTPIKRPRKKDIVVIPGFTPGSLDV
jgi:hypothetical protein